MPAHIHPVQRFLLILALALFGTNTALAQSVPMLVQAEAMTLVAPMTAGYDIAAMGGRFISPTSGTSTMNPVRSASVQVNVPAAGTYYLWARMAGPTDLSDALYVGIDTSFDRIFPSTTGVYEWVRVETSNASGVFGFSLAAGAHDIQVGYGEIGAKLDAVYLTSDANEVPSFTPPMRLAIEAETLTLTAPMTVGSEVAANGGQFISPTSGTNSTTPVREASIAIDVPAGTYYLWARMAGPTDTSDALYVGIDSSFDRIFPSAQGPYEWVRVETADSSGSNGFALGAGVHTVQVGHGEIGAKLDGVYLTTDANDVPTLAPMRRVIEAETMILTAPMTVGVENDASGAQYISPTSGTTSTTPVREASTTLTVPATGTYYIWARLKGLTDASDALYVGFDNSWDRVFPSATGAYEWVRVETGDGSGTFGFALTAGAHDIQVGHGEIGARLDAVYVSDDANDSPAGSTPAGFPAPCANPSGGYQGFGHNTTGGAGQPIYHVTNRNDSGAGSLRDALSQGNRCVVFDVGGQINLVSDELHVKGANVTIDGFTAPSPGITLGFLPDDTRDLAALVIHGNQGTGNVVVRGIRIRHANDDGITVTTFGGNGQLRNIVIDRVSVADSKDGAIDVTGDVQDVTIQWSILGRGNPAHPYPMLIAPAPDASGNMRATTRVSVHHNLFAFGDFRNPRCQHAGGALPQAIVCDLRNNLIWDWTGNGTQIDFSGTVNVIKNYYYTSFRLDENGDTPSDARAISVQPGGGSAYVADNESRNNFNLNDNGNRPTEFPVDPADIPATTRARDAALAVKAGAGARGPNFGLDAADQATIDDINRVGIP